MIRIAIAAAGTGGHIFPGIAIAKELVQQVKDANIVFIGAKNGLENKIVTEYDFDIFQIDVKKLHRRLTLENLLFPFYLIKSYCQTIKILRQLKIDIFIGCGGFVSGAVGFAAFCLRIPLFLQEQNSFPGISTRLLSKISKRIYLGNQDAKKFLDCKKTKLLFTGNPVREFAEIDRKNALNFWKLEDKRTIFIYGGSQGSHFINQTFSEIIEEILKNDIQIIFQTGKNDFEEINRKFGAKKDVVVQPFFDNIEYAYTASDLVICRAGAISLAEISRFRLPAILIPFPYSAGQHQLKNAQSFEQKGAAKIILEENLNPKLLLQEILYLLNEKNKIKKMSESAKNLDVQDSTIRIVKDIINFFREAKKC